MEPQGQTRPRSVRSSSAIIDLFNQSIDRGRHFIGCISHRQVIGFGVPHNFTVLTIAQDDTGALVMAWRDILGHPLIYLGIVINFKKISFEEKLLLHRRRGLAILVFEAGQFTSVTEAKYDIGRSRDD